MKDLIDGLSAPLSYTFANYRLCLCESNETLLYRSWFLWLLTLPWFQRWRFLYTSDSTLGNGSYPPFFNFDHLFFLTFDMYFFKFNRWLDHFFRIHHALLHLISGFHLSQFLLTQHTYRFYIGRGDCLTRYEILDLTPSDSIITSGHYYSDGYAWVIWFFLEKVVQLGFGRGERKFEGKL